MGAFAAQAHSRSVQVSPLVGRERERALLREQLDGVLAGRGGLVLIGGEAGIGKTALAEALLVEASDRGALTTTGRCYDLTETPPFGPWAEILAALSTERDPAPLPAPLGGGEGAASQSALFAAAREHFAAVAARQPLVALLDDLHWADQSSLALLRALARQSPGLPLLLLVTYRADEISRRHPLFQLLPLLARESRAAQLELRPLSDEAVRDLTQARYALPPADDARLVRYLRERAEGHPFFLGELLTTLEDAGDLRLTDDGWQLGDLNTLRVPRLLRQVVEARLARLSDEDQRLLAVAAVIGQEVPLDLWSSVAGVGEEALLDTLERASAARLAEEMEDGARARFVHALIRETLHAATSPSRRRSWQRRVGDALAAQPAPDPDAVAYHFRQAGDPRAAEWLVRAGERAHRAHALLTAGERYEGALALLPDDAAHAAERGWLLLRLAQVRDYGDARRVLADLDQAERLAVAVGDQALAAASLCRRGRAHFMLGEQHQAFACLEAGVAAVEALPVADRARLNRLQLLRDDESAANLYLGLLVLQRGFAGPYPAAVALGEGLVSQQPTHAAPGPSFAALGSLRAACDGLGVAHALLGQPDAARRFLGEARACSRLLGNHFGLGATAEMELKLVVLTYAPERVAARHALAAEVEREFGLARDAVPLVPRLYCVPLLVLEGAWAEARALAAEGSTGATNVGARTAARGWLGLLARAQGEPDLAWEQVRAAFPDGPATEPVEVGLEGPRLLLLAAALATDAGDLPVTRRWLACHDRWLAWSGAVLGRSEGALGWAAYHRAAGDLAAAREHAGRALAAASEPGQPLALLAAHRLLGELATAAPRHADAQAHLDAALALADACAAPYERALTLLALAELRAATGQQAAAQAPRSLAPLRWNPCSPLPPAQPIPPD
jgi:hypothetical protein